MKSLFKFLLLVLATIVVFSAVSAFMPYSHSFKTANQSADPSVILYVFIAVAWTCFAIVYIVIQSSWRKTKLMIYLTVILFLVIAFMTQIETLFFGHAFKVLTTGDILLIMVANGSMFVVAVPLSVAFFKRKDEPKAIAEGTSLFDVPGLTAKLSLIGISYVVIYFVFGYFVAWSVKDLRAFYTGHETDHGFIGTQLINLQERPIIYPFQFIRGVLFGLFVLPLIQMFPGRPGTLLVSLILVFSSVGITLIIPNVLFPDTVRWAHFREMTSSMCVFALLIWWIYRGRRLQDGPSVQGQRQ
jgi:hypothetical protein